MLNGFGDIDGALAQIEAAGVKAVHHNADMTKPEEIEAMIAFALEKFGSLDILVNNADIQHVATIDEFPVEHWDAIIAINLSSAFYIPCAPRCPLCAKRAGAASSISGAWG